MKTFISLIIGEDQDYRVIYILLFPALIFVIFTLLSYELNLYTIITSVFAFDIFAGLISNLQPKTHSAWSRLSVASRYAFIIIHITIYPLLVVIFQISLPLMGFMLSMLLAKTLAFIFGNKVI